MISWPTTYNVFSGIICVRDLFVKFKVYDKWKGAVMSSAHLLKLCSKLFSRALSRALSLSPHGPEPTALRDLDLWQGGTANRFGSAPGLFGVYGLLGTSLLSLPAEPIRMFWKLSPLVATGKLCFLPVPRNSWRGCWQLAALPLRSALWDETCRISLFSSFFFFPDCHPSYPAV